MAENDVTAKLSARQRRALSSLLAGNDKHSAAEAAGVSVRTIERYRNDPAFRRALDQATGEAIGNAARKLVGAMETAVTTMQTLAKDVDTPAGVRLRACITIIELGPRLLETHELAERISVLERRLEEFFNE